MRGTPAAFAALLQSEQKPNSVTLYFISEKDSNDAVLYLGSKLIAGGGDATNIELSLSNLTDISIKAGLQDKDILVYDSGSKKWVNSSLESAISVFLGATNTDPGKAGLVPAPAAG
jgi:hypothetical protein